MRDFDAKPTRGIGGHHSACSGTVEWLTPRWILDALPRFDLDPCAPMDPPWLTADRSFNIEHDGLSQPWAGRVWLNPPYGRETWKWLSRLVDHGDGIALIFARTETVQFHASVWERADAVLFLKGRINFCYPSGMMSPKNAGAPSVLVAYGERNVESLRMVSALGHIGGKFIRLRDPA